ncbi:MAG: ATP-binding protein [Candidatus Aminicenantes bacterium]|nr:ATP-binding protein [Candidatus Aminicenantes bacterium]
MTPESICPICQGNRWVLEESGGSVRARRCGCLAERRSKVLLEQARIPRRYQSCSIETFEEHNDSHKNAKKICKKLIDNYPEQYTGLLFLGDCGVGKTHLAVAIIKELIEKKSACCIFYDCRELIRNIYSSFSSESPVSDSEIIAPIIHSDVLVLDELGAKQDTPWVEEVIFYIINSRYNEKKLTIFTSNYPDSINEEDDDKPSKSGFFKDTKRKETLEDRIGFRIYSKICEMCRKVHLFGKDYRTEYKQKGYQF